MENIKTWIKKEPELAGSFFMALLSCLFVRPTAKYLDYIDFNVLIMLFCLMIIINGFAKNNLFASISRYFVNKAHQARELCFILISACFFSAMLVTNDVALIIFVPLASTILGSAGLHGYTLFVIVMQTVAANLGSMLSPIGNPQNLFLYSYYNLTFWEFIKITLPVTIASFAIIVPTTFWFKKKHIRTFIPEKSAVENKAATAIFATLFLLCMATVFHILPYKILLLTVCITILITDKSLFKHVDYKLLLTFVFFFIFCGNITSLNTVRELFIPYLSGNELIVSIISSQFISNVPSAFILSGFTENYKDLILGTNIGGLGTLIASMASLISFRYYKIIPKANPLKYLYVFTVTNIIMLIILLLFVKFI